MVDRLDIIEAAADLFARDGFDATSVADISRAVGLSASAGGMYRHFKSKAAIFDAIFDNYYSVYGRFLSEVDTNISMDLGEDKRALAHGLLSLALCQAKHNASVIKLYFREQNRLNDAHLVQASALRAKSIASFEFVCNHIAGNASNFDAQAVAAILIDSINLRVSNFAPEFGITEERYLSSLTDLLFALVTAGKD